MLPIARPLHVWTLRARVSARDGQVSLDRVPGAMEHRQGAEVGLGHPERLLDVQWVVVAARTSRAGWWGIRVALESDQPPRACKLCLLANSLVAVVLTNRFWAAFPPATTSLARFAGVRVPLSLTAFRGLSPYRRRGMLFLIPGRLVLAMTAF